MASTVPPPASFCSVNPRPATQWNILLHPETESRKAWRSFGRFLTFFSLPSAAATGYAATYLTATPKTIIRTSAGLALLTVASAIAGTILWFFNRQIDNEQLLLKQRNQVGYDIVRKPIAEIRDWYSKKVVSNEELNEWIRYLAGETTYEFFILEQGERILDLELDTETKALLGAKFKEHVKKQDLGFDAVKQNKAYHKLLTDADKKELLTYCANKFVDKTPQTPEPKIYESFVNIHGKEGLLVLEDHQKRVLSGSFIRYHEEMNLGISMISKEDYKTEHQVFGEEVFNTLYRSFANQDALKLSYQQFVQRNGVEGIGHITVLGHLLYESFCTYVLNLRIGCIEVRNRFGEAIKKFGVNPEGIYERVLNYEYAELGLNTTYKQFRDRNGIEIIQVNPQLAGPFRSHFLKLKYADLVNPEYQEDRTLLGITRDDIKKTLEDRWKAMTFKEIWEQDSEGFKASMKGDLPFFSPKDWTEKAAREFEKAEMKDVLKFASLFQMGILAVNEDFKTRIKKEIESVKTLGELFKDYRAGFDLSLLDIKMAKVQALLLDFMYENAEGYLTERFHPSVIEVARTVLDLKLLETFFGGNIRSAVEGRENEFKRHQETLENLRTSHEKTTKELETRASTRIEEFKRKADISGKEKQLKELEAELAKEQYKQFLESDLMTSFEQKQLQLAKKEGRAKILQDENLITKIKVAEIKKRKASEELEKAREDARRRESQSLAPKLQRDIASLEKELEEVKAIEKELKVLNVDTPAFQDRKKVLLERVKNPSVTGLGAALRAPADPASELKELEKKEKKAAELKSKIKTPTNGLEQQLVTKYYELRQLKESFQVSSILIETEADCMRELRELQDKQKELKDLFVEISSLKAEIASLQRQLPGILSNMFTGISRVNLQSNVDEARKNLEKARKELADDTLAIHQQLTTNKANELSKHQSDLRLENIAHESKLSLILSGFRLSIFNAQTNLKISGK